MNIDHVSGLKSVSWEDRVKLARRLSLKIGEVIRAEMLLTSFYRSDSVTHREGLAWDLIIKEIKESPTYPLARGRSPVLFIQPLLLYRMFAFQFIEIDEPIMRDNELSLVIFIEDDHFHCHYIKWDEDHVKLHGRKSKFFVLPWSDTKRGRGAIQAYHRAVSKDENLGMSSIVNRVNKT